MNIEDVLKQRGAVHGEHKEQFRIAQNLKLIAHRSRNWEKMPLEMREIIESDLVKLSRILTGDFNYADHWFDRVGYLYLKANELFHVQEAKKTD